jgi:hypothetical protein
MPAFFQGRAEIGRERRLAERVRIHHHVYRFRGDDDFRLAGNPEFGRQRERSIAQARGADRQVQHLIVTRRSFPLDNQLDQLVVETAAGQSLAEPERAHELSGRKIDVVGVARVEHHLLRVALAVAHA